MNVDNINKGTFGFIVGSGRSGTTVLTKILNSHSKICCPTAENFFLSSFLQLFGKKTSFTKQEIDAIIDNLWNLDTINQHIWKINSDNLKQLLQRHKKNLDFVLLMKIIFAHFGGNTQQDNFAYFLDKNPHYVYYLKELNSIFPDAKFIFIVRDYRGKYNSVKKVRNRFLSAVGISWAIQQKKILNFQKLHPDKCLLIRYEDLTYTPNDTLQTICRFLSIDFEEQMLRHFEVSKIEYQKLPLDEATIRNQLKWHENSERPLNTQSVNKWQQELSDKEIKMLDYYCGKTGELFGYKPIYKPFSIWEKLLIEIRYRPLFILIHGFPYGKKLFFRLSINQQRKLILFLKRTFTLILRS